MKEKGEGPREEVRFRPLVARGPRGGEGNGGNVRTRHGESLFSRADLRALAAEMGLGLFKFTGNPMQRGFWPRSLLLDRLRDFGARSGHSEIGNAPLFLYGHSNGTGFSAVFPSYEPERVWAWVSMRPGITFQVYQPGAAQVPGLVIFGRRTLSSPAPLARGEPRRRSRPAEKARRAVEYRGRTEDRSWSRGEDLAARVFVSSATPSPRACPRTRIRGRAPWS